MGKNLNEIRIRKILHVWVGLYHENSTYETNKKSHKQNL